MQIFLCHSSSDKEYVRKLYQRLRSDGYDVWLDEVNLLPGEEWDPEIRRQVRQSDVVLVCLSNNSLIQESYVQREINIALDEAEAKPDDTIYIIPAKIEPCAVPRRLVKWHWVDLFAENGYAKLRSALDRREDQLKRRDASRGDHPPSPNWIDLEPRGGALAGNSRGAKTIRNKKSRDSLSGARSILAIILMLLLLYAVYSVKEYQEISYVSSVFRIQRGTSDQEMVEVRVFYPRRVSPSDNWKVTVQLQGRVQRPGMTLTLVPGSSGALILTEDQENSFYIEELEPGVPLPHVFSIQGPIIVNSDVVDFRFRFDNGFSVVSGPIRFWVDVVNQGDVLRLMAFPVSVLILLSAILWPSLKEFFDSTSSTAEIDEPSTPPLKIRGMELYPLNWLPKVGWFFLVAAIVVSGINNLSMLGVLPACCGFSPAKSPTPTLTFMPSMTPTSTLTAIPVSETPTLTLTPTSMPTQTITATLTLIPTQTITATLTPMPTATTEPTLYRGLDRNCLDPSWWKINFYAGEPQLVDSRNCWDLSAWGIIPNEGGIDLAVTDADLGVNITRRFRTKLEGDTEIKFTINIDQFTTNPNFDGQLMFGIGSSITIQDSGFYLKYIVAAKDNKIYRETAPGLESYYDPRSTYTLEEKQNIIIRVIGNQAKILADGVVLRTTSLEPHEHSVFWICYSLPANNGSLIAYVTDLRFEDH